MLDFSLSSLCAAQFRVGHFRLGQEELHMGVGAFYGTALWLCGLSTNGMPLRIHNPHRRVKVGA